MRDKVKRKDLEARLIVGGKLIKISNEGQEGDIYQIKGTAIYVPEEEQFKMTRNLIHAILYKSGCEFITVWRKIEEGTYELSLLRLIPREFKYILQPRKGFFKKFLDRLNPREAYLPC